MSVCSREPLDKIIATVDPLILLLLHIAVRARDSIDEAIEVRVAKVRDAVSGRVDFALVRARRLDHTMNGRLDRVVAPPCQKITGVNHHSVFDRRGVHEGSCRALHLEAASGVLEEQGDAAVVAVL